MIVSLWNKLDGRIRKITNVDSFKREIKTSLFLMVSHRGHNCIFSALTILDSALTS